MSCERRPQPQIQAEPGEPHGIAMGKVGRSEARYQQRVLAVGEIGIEHLRALLLQANISEVRWGFVGGFGTEWALSERVSLDRTRPRRFGGGQPPRLSHRGGRRRWIGDNLGSPKPHRWSAEDIRHYGLLSGEGRVMRGSNRHAHPLDPPG
jgi:hypothetical protein